MTEPTTNPIHTTLAEASDDVTHTHRMMGVYRDRLATALDAIGDAFREVRAGDDCDEEWPDVNGLTLNQQAQLMNLASAVIEITNVRQCLADDEARLFVVQRAVARAVQQ